MQSIDSQTIITDAPVAYLLFLEKQLQDIEIFINYLLVLSIDC